MRRGRSHSLSAKQGRYVYSTVNSVITSRDVDSFSHHIALQYCLPIGDYMLLLLQIIVQAWSRLSFVIIMGLLRPVKAVELLIFNGFELIASDQLLMETGHLTKHVTKCHSFNDMRCSSTNSLALSIKGILYIKTSSFCNISVLLMA